MCYGLVRTTHTLERAGFVQTNFVKFVWVYWRPEDIPVRRKMKIGVHEGLMKQLFAPYHADLNASEIDGVGPEPLRTLLDSVTMRCVCRFMERWEGCVCVCVCVLCDGCPRLHSLGSVVSSLMPDTSQKLKLSSCSCIRPKVVVSKLITTLLTAFHRRSNYLTPQIVANT